MNGVEHGKGYVIYGLPTPKGTLTVSNVAQTIAGGTPTSATNGTTRLAALTVITANSFDVKLSTVPVVIGGFTDVYAGGDNAMLSINHGVGSDGYTGVDLNGNGQVDYRNQGNVVYGFENFLTKKSPLYNASGPAGDGEYVQTIDTSKLPEGYNYLEVRAFRNRPANEPAVYSSFKKVLYVDRLPPPSSVASFQPWDAGNSQNRDLIVRSDDATATQANVFLNLPANISDAEIVTRALTNNENPASQYDRDTFKYGFFGVPSGNNVITIVLREITGNYSIKRITGQMLATNKGAGLGDLNFDGAYTTADVTGNSSAFEAVHYSENTANWQFNPAADFNGDGRVTFTDMVALRAKYKSLGSGAVAASNAAKTALLTRVNFDGNSAGPSDVDLLVSKYGVTIGNWSWDLNNDGNVSSADLALMINGAFETRFGDANLNGFVDFNDLLALASAYGGAGGWAQAISTAITSSTSTTCWCSPPTTT
ncbi:MAG: hypothetical protein QM770_08700 [Tepidisphaeraceae bacterium]